MLRTPLLGAAICALATACALAPRKPNEVEAGMRQLVGEPLLTAVRVLGQPHHAFHPTRAPGSKGTYAWSMTGTELTGRLTYVQTGQRLVGTRQVGQSGGGHGVAPTPVFEEVYEPVGHYGPERIVHLCEISVSTNSQGTILDVGVIGCD